LDHLARRRSFAWRCEKVLRLHGTDHPVVYLDRELTRALTQRLYLAGERALAALLPLETEFYIPAAIDGLVHVELLSKYYVSEEADKSAIGMGEYKSFFWDQLDDWKGAMLRRPCYLPLDQTDLEPKSISSNAEIDEACEELLDTLGPLHSLRGPDQLITILSVLELYEASVYGRGHMDRIHQEVATLSKRMIADPETIGTHLYKQLIGLALHFDHLGFAAELAKSGGIATRFESDYLDYIRHEIELTKYHAREIRSDLGFGPLSVIGSVVWGPSYVKKYLDYQLASLLSPGNIPSLAKRGKVVLSIVTCERGRDQIIEHPVYSVLCGQASVHFTLFDEAFLIERVNAAYNFNSFCGLLDHLNVAFAKAIGGDLYLLSVNSVFSDGSLANLNRYLSEGADCCSVSSIESEESNVCEEIETERRGTLVLNFSSEKLFEIAGSCAGKYFRSLIVSPVTNAFCRHPRALVWPVDDGFRLHSLYMHPIAISARMLARDFHPQNQNVDCALIPRLLQDDGILHIVSEASEVGIVELSSREYNQNDYASHGFSLIKFINDHSFEAVQRDVINRLYPIQREAFSRSQFFLGLKLEVPNSGSYEAEYRAIEAAISEPHYGQHLSAEKFVSSDKTVKQPDDKLLN